MLHVQPLEIPVLHSRLRPPVRRISGEGHTEKAGQAITLTQTSVAPYMQVDEERLLRAQREERHRLHALPPPWDVPPRLCGPQVDDPFICFGPRAPRHHHNVIRPPGGRNEPHAADGFSRTGLEIRQALVPLPPPDLHAAVFRCRGDPVASWREADVEDDVTMGPDQAETPGELGGVDRKDRGGLTVLGGGEQLLDAADLSEVEGAALGYGEVLLWGEKGRGIVRQ
jgi:hypothetical protein